MRKVSMLLFNVLIFNSFSTWATAQWGYSSVNGPLVWGDLDPAFATCKDGREQSPVLLSSCQAVNNRGLIYSYQASLFDIKNSPKWVELNNPSKNNSLEFSRKIYKLEKVIFRTPSEHIVDERKFPLEIQFVHKSDDNRLLIVAVLAEPGKSGDVAPNIFRALANKSFSEPIEDVNLMSLLPDDKSFFYYMGSLTTPPCTEGVQWLVMRNALKLEQEHIKTLSDMHPNNSRPVNRLFQRRLIKLGN